MNKPLTREERQEAAKLLKSAIFAYMPSKYVRSLIAAVDQLEMDATKEFEQTHAAQEEV